MSNMVTRCPKCGTAFRITSTQLQSAKGAVRCGSCLHIFKAQDHLVHSTASKPTAEPQSPVPKTQVSRVENPRPATPVAAASKAPSSRAQPARVSAHDSSPQKAPATNPLTAKASASASGSTPPAPKADEAQATTAKHSVTDKLAFNQSVLDREIAASDDDNLLISDDMYKPVKTKKDDYGFDGFLDLDALPQQSVSLFERNTHQRALEKEGEPDPDESWAESLLEEADHDNKIAAVKQQISTAETHDQTKTVTAEQIVDSNPQGLVFSLIGEVPTTPPSEAELREIFTEEELGEEIRASSTSEQAIPSAPPLHAYDTSRAALLMNIMPEPVEMTASRNPGWRRRRLWPLLALAMFMLLIAQLAWLQFDHLSRIQPYRSAYQVICPWAGCSLPVLSDRSKIRVRNLVVSKHRDVEDALKVDLILINTAPFEQPFPDLFMEFSSLSGQSLASRRFSPREYLAGELAGYQLMPHNRPIHISLELVDPGEDAVNYKIEPL